MANFGHYGETLQAFPVKSKKKQGVRYYVTFCAKWSKQLDKGKQSEA